MSLHLVYGKLHIKFEQIWYHKSRLKTMFGNVWKNAFTCTRCPILQNELQVYEILILKTFKVNENLKDTYVLSNYACYNHNSEITIILIIV